VFLCGTAPRADATQLTVTSTASFPTTYTAFTDSVTQQDVFFPSQAIATINPFNAALGTLDKVSINWDFGGSFTGTAGSNSGSATFSIGGNAYVNTSNYSGGGGGGSNNAGPGVTFSASQSNGVIDQDFLPAGAGQAYDPALLAAFTGANPYTVTFFSGGRYFYYNSVVSGTATSYRDVAVTYTYTAAPSAVPEIDPATGGSALSLVVGLAARQTFGRPGSSRRARRASTLAPPWSACFATNIPDLRGLPEVVRRGHRARRRSNSPSDPITRARALTKQFGSISGTDEERGLARRKPMA